APSKTIYATGRNSPIAQLPVCSTLHRYRMGYVITAWSLLLQQLRWAVTDERSWHQAPFSTCYFFSLKPPELGPTAARRRRRPASVQSSAASGIADSSWITRCDRPASVLSLHGVIPLFFPPCLTGAFCGVVSVCSPPSIPLSWPSCPGLTRDIGDTRSEV